MDEDLLVEFRKQLDEVQLHVGQFLKCREDQQGYEAHRVLHRLKSDAAFLEQEEIASIAGEMLVPLESNESNYGALSEADLEELKHLLSLFPFRFDSALKEGSSE